jgi:uncharacterized repeat protein (TIGR01451 family)
MKNLYTPIKLSISLAALLLSQASFGAGTDAGVDVTNTATISYTVGQKTQTPISSAPAVFKVDRKINLILNGTSANNLVKVVPLTADNELNYSLQNTGNSDEFFKIEVEHMSAPVDTIDAGTPAQICQFTIDGSTYDITDTPVVELTEDEVQAIVVSCDMPDRSATFVDGATSAIKVVATAVADNAGTPYVENINDADRILDIDVVFADAVGTDDAARDAKFSARETYEVAMPMLSVLKSSVVIEDPINNTDNPKRIPGATVRYTITVQNYSLTSVATDVVVTDSLDAEITAGNFAFKANSITNAASSTPGTFASNVVTAGGITVPVATSASAPGTAEVTFDVIITE